ncbi:putative membrane protein [Hoeflea marina]|uniref:Putative membrane protein n=1 Tax=Hoeflea marina TaxID=274592 RepID=A0A317PPF5_9HYPH|nr:DUF2177 family protein [Hoeflea marina]PWW02019.1 putative membrane protein [Hoeflea marina]
MTAVTFLKAWGVAAFVLLLADGIWLGLVAGNFYRSNLGDLMRSDIRFGVAAIFYIMFAAAVVILAGMPGARAAHWSAALFYGAVLGFAAYGTYDFTNLATLKSWPVIVTIVDLCWGTALTAVAALAASLVLRVSH